MEENNRIILPDWTAKEYSIIYQSNLTRFLWWQNAATKARTRTGIYSDQKSSWSLDYNQHTKNNQICRETSYFSVAWTFYDISEPNQGNAATNSWTYIIGIFDDYFSFPEAAMEAERHCCCASFATGVWGPCHLVGNTVRLPWASEVALFGRNWITDSLEDAFCWACFDNESGLIWAGCESLIAWFGL